jgi:hypothetical protein
MASVYRQLELPCPRNCPTPTTGFARLADLMAWVMPFDLVIDEETADGREARVSKGWYAVRGVVAGTLRYFADRPAIRAAASRDAAAGTRFAGTRDGAPSSRVRAAAPAERSRAVRRLTYFGFLLERDAEPPDPFLEDCQRRRAALSRRCSRAPPGRVRGARPLRVLLASLRGRLRAAGPRRSPPSSPAIRQCGLGMLSSTPVSLDVEADVSPVRGELEALPASIHLLGDRIPVEYEVEKGRRGPAAGQGRAGARLRSRDLLRSTGRCALRCCGASGSRPRRHPQDLQRQLTGLSQGSGKGWSIAVGATGVAESGCDATSACRVSYP